MLRTLILFVAGVVILGLCPVPRATGIVAGLPAQLDLATAQGIVKIAGEPGQGRFGSADLAVADLNGDEVADLVVSAPDAYGTRGAVYCIWGVAGVGLVSRDLSLVPADVTIVGPTTGSQLGIAIAVADLDGDGGVELYVATEGYAPQFGRRASGGVLVFDGMRLASTSRIDLSSDLADACLADVDDPRPVGSDLGTGDFDNDGFTDLAIGARRSEGASGQEAAGATWIFHGARDLAFDRVFDLRLEPNVTRVGGLSAGDGLGSDVAVGDVTGDLRDDLVLGTPERSGTRSGIQPKAGELMIVSGESLVAGARLDPNVDAPYLRLYSNEYGDYLGRGLGVADVTGDGLADVAVGLIDGDGPRNRRFPDCGEVYVLESNRDYEHGTILDAQDAPYWQWIVGDAPKRFLGNTIGIGDLDGDNVAEIVVSSQSAPGPNGQGSGAVYVIAAGAGTYDLAETAPGTVAYGEATSDGFGTRVLVADVTGDGVGDVIASAPDSAGGRGSVFVIPGERVFANSPPVLDLPGEVVAPIGAALDLVVTATDPDGHALRLSAVGLPIGAVFRNLGGGQAEISFVPEASQEGTFDVTVRATDGQAVTSAPLVIRVADVDRPRIEKAVYAKNKLKITGEGFDESSEVRINGVAPVVSVRFKPAKGKLVLKASRADLGLVDEPGGNRIVVVVDGVASEPYAL